MSKITYYHAGCPVCVEAERALVSTILNTYPVKVINLGEDKKALEEAKNIGVKSVPALIMDGNVFHINFGAALSDIG